MRGVWPHFFLRTSVPTVGPPAHYRVDTEFLIKLADGSARNTLQALDLSSTLVTDADVEPVALFDALREIQLNQCPHITKRTLFRICGFGVSLEVVGLNGSEIPVPVILDAVAGAPGSDPLPKLKELYMESEEWSKFIPEMQNFLSRRPNLAQLRVWSIVPQLDYRTYPISTFSEVF